MIQACLTGVSLGASSDRVERHGRYQYLHRRSRFAQRGPLFLARALQKSLEERRETIKYIFVTGCGPDNFQSDLQEYPSDDLLVPANKYEEPDILETLSKMPEAEQPSHGWKWFCHKYNIDSFGIGKDLHLKYDGIRVRKQSRGHELGWGYPFWDKKKLEKWGVIKPSSFKKKKTARKGKDDVESSEQEVGLSYSD